jgi:hypothetical protein
VVPSHSVIKDTIESFNNASILPPIERELFNSRKAYLARL